MPRYWIGDAPQKCDLCGCTLTDTFTDGKTRMGPWANMCAPCHKRNGGKTGTGVGQTYAKQSDGKWMKVAG